MFTGRRGRQELSYYSKDMFEKVFEYHVVGRASLTYGEVLTDRGRILSNMMQTAAKHQAHPGLIFQVG